MAVNSAAVSQIVGGFSGIGNTLMIIGTILVVFFIIGMSILYGLWMKRFVYNVIVYRNFGNGKGSLQYYKAGKFKANRTFFGMIDSSGPMQLLTNERNMMRWTPRIIQEQSDHDMQDINWKKGFVVMQSPEDNQILIPIGKIKCENEELLFDIASADFRDTALRCQEEAEKAMSGKFDKLLQYAVPIILFVIALIIIMVVLQGTQRILNDAYTHAESIVNAAKTIATTIPSQAP
jgi:hypothetical protein